MAKAKLRKPRIFNNLDDKKNLQNGYYVHSSPPKVVDTGGSGSSKIREYVRAGNISALEEILLNGQGQSLINQPSTDKSVRAFLKTVPSYISKIDLVHDAAERGNLRDLKALMDRRKLARSKDKQGVGILHKAVLYGHKDVADYLITEYPETIDIQDKEGRVAMHYTAATKKPGEMFDFLRQRLNDEQVMVKDNKGRSPFYFMEHPSELSVTRNESPRTNFASRIRRANKSKKNSPIQKTPPKRDGLNITGANIRIWIHDQDLPKLEQIVWEGQGHRLTNETSNNPRVRQFLKLVPRMMSKIKQVHQAPLSGDLETLEAIVDQPELLSAKDHNGLNPLHRAAALGHYDVCKWIVEKNPQAVLGVDKKGRTPLHFATYPTDGGEIYNLFVENGADPAHPDQFDKTPEDYRGRPGDIDVTVVYDPPSAPRLGDVNVVYKNQKLNSQNPSRNPSGKRRKFGSWVTSPQETRNEEENRRKPQQRIDRRNPKFIPRTNKKDPNKLTFSDMSNAKERDIDRMIQDGSIDKMEMVILSGMGEELKGRSSWNDQVRRFLKKVPTYMEKLTQLKEASAEGDAQTVRKLLKDNPKYSMGRGRDGSVALHHAAKSGSIDIVRQLVDLYPDGVFVEDRDQRAPLHWAAMSREPGSHETYDYLESKGSNAKLPDADGKTASDYFKETVTFHDVRNNLTPASRNSRRNSKASLLTPEENKPRTESRNRSRSKDKPRSRSRSRNNSRPSSKSRSRNNSQTRSRSENNLNSKSDKKPSSRSRNRSKSRNGNKSNPPSNAPSRSMSRADSDQKKKQSLSPTKGKSRSRSRSRSKSRSDKRSRSRSKNRDADKSPKVSPRKSKSRGESKANSREPSRTKSRASPLPSKEESKRAVQDAEKGDFEALSSIILRGDGEKLLGMKSKDGDVQDFLDKLPKTIEDAKDAQKAAENGSLRTLKMLLDKKAKGRVKDSNGSNLIHLAVLNGNTEIVRFLTQNYPELLSDQDDQGMTPLHYSAVVRDGGHLYKILQTAGADEFVEDKAGHSAEFYLHNPEALGHKELQLKLRERKRSFASGIASSV